MEIIFYDEIKILNGKVLYIAIPKKYDIAGYKSGMKVRVKLEMINQDE